jgi:hypothetical protein
MNIPKMIEVGYKVRCDREDKPLDVVRTLDMSNLSEEDIMSYALDSIIILSQAKDRRDAVKKENPVPIRLAGTFVVGKPGFKTVMSAKGKIEKALGKDVAEKAIAKYGSAEAALNAMKALIGEE